MVAVVTVAARRPLSHGQVAGDVVHGAEVQLRAIRRAPTSRSAEVPFSEINVSEKNPQAQQDMVKKFGEPLFRRSRSAARSCRVMSSRCWRASSTKLVIRSRKPAPPSRRRKPRPHNNPHPPPPPGRRAAVFFLRACAPDENRQLERQFPERALAAGARVAGGRAARMFLRCRKPSLSMRISRVPRSTQPVTRPCTRGRKLITALPCSAASRRRMSWPLSPASITCNGACSLPRSMACA